VGVRYRGPNRETTYKTAGQIMDCVILSGFEGPVWNRALGPYLLCHHLRKNGFSARVIDFTNHMSTSTIDEILDKFVNSSTKVVGLSTTFLAEQNELVDYMHKSDKLIPDAIINSLRKIKEKFPNIKIVAGGAKSVYLKDLNFVDIIVHGFAEDALLKLLRDIGTPNIHFYRKENNKIIIPGENTSWKIDSSDFRFTDTDGILPGETLPIEVSRGCIFKCKFCAYPLLGKKKFDYLRDPKCIKDEMLYNYEKWGTTVYTLTDDTFNDSTHKLEAILKEVSTLPFKINFITYLRLDLIKAHPEQAAILKELGLISAFFGLETLNQKSASIVGKGANVRSMKEFLPELYYNLWKGDISIFSSFIVGLPFETETSIRETFSYLKEYSDFNPSFWPLSFRGGYYLSEFEKDPAKYEYIIRSETDWNSPWMSSKDALRLVEESNEIFNNKPSTWLTASLISQGYNRTDLLNTQIADLNFKSLYRQKLNMVKKYRELIT
jgi:radical SAM superfamily enzyme YgiQ (UPF0313 family)